MQSFEDLAVWRRAFRLIKPVYRLTAKYPKEEKYGLIAQTRKCVVAVPSNIAEGTRRRTRGEFRNSLSVASGENAEHECLLMAAVELEFATPEEVRELLNEARGIARMITGLDTTLAQRYAKPPETTRPPHSKSATPRPPTRPPNY